MHLHTELTSVAVGASPAVEADAVAVRRAAVVAVVVVARSTEPGAARTVVVARADDTVVEQQRRRRLGCRRLGLRRRRHLRRAAARRTRPVTARVQQMLRRVPPDQSSRTACNTHPIRSDPIRFNGRRCSSLPVSPLTLHVRTYTDQ